jgi:hypothetical protein
LHQESENSWKGEYIFVICLVELMY